MTYALFEPGNITLTSNLCVLSSTMKLVIIRASLITFIFNVAYSEAFQLPLTDGQALYRKYILYMYRYMYVYICIGTYMFICVYVYACLKMYRYMYVYICIGMFTYV